MEYWKFLRKHVGQERIIIPGADGALIRENKVLLVLNRGDNKWYLPGGLQEIGESIEQTVFREIKEELGIESKVKDLVAIYSNPLWNKTYPNGDKVQPLTFLFIMDIIGNNEIDIDQKEILEYQYFDYEKIPDNTANYAVQMCRDLKNYRGKVLIN